MSFFRIPLEIKVQVIGFLVGLAHLVAGISVWMEPSALQVTALATFRWLVEYVGAGAPSAAIFLMVAGVMALIGARGGYHKVVRAVLFVPQQFLLSLQVWAIFMVFVHGQYPDGYTPVGQGWFILSDQFLIWLCALAHTTWLTGLIFFDGDGRERVRGD